MEKEEREWCAGLHAAVFYPWVEQLARLLDHDAPAPPPTVWCVTTALFALLGLLLTRYQAPQPLQVLPPLP